MANKKVFTEESLATFVDEIKSYTDDAVSTKANSSHSHAISDVVDLQTTLDEINETANTQSDWNQNDETAPDYIKNRTHYSKVEYRTFVPELTVEITEYASIAGTENGFDYGITFVEGETYVVILNGVTYECVAWYSDNIGGWVIGNGSIYGGEGMGEDVPFSCDSYSSGGCYLNVSETGSYTIEISGNGEVVYQLDEKYMPDSVTKKAGLKVAGTTYLINDEEVVAAEGAEIFNDYVRNIASGYHSHAEGCETTASGDYSHAEGDYTTASGQSSHAEGNGTTASGDSSHAEGGETTASGQYSHAEGYKTTASGVQSHAEGYQTTASSWYSHAEGYQTTVTSDTTVTATSTTSTDKGYYGHAEGYGTVVTGTVAHAEGNGTTASGDHSHAEGYNTIASSDGSHAEGYNTIASGRYSHAEGYNTTVSGDYSHAEGYFTTASANCSHAEGVNTTASGEGSHAEGNGTTASGRNSHAEGYRNVALGLGSHIEGGSDSELPSTITSSTDNESIISSWNTTKFSLAKSQYSHAEGYDTLALEAQSHAEGLRTIAMGNASHAEGLETRASGQYSHAEGSGTTASHKSQHVQGEYNILDTSTNGATSRGTYAHIVGNGTGTSARSNAHTLDWSGNAWFAGEVYVGGTAQGDGTSQRLAKINEVTLTQLGITATSDELNVLDGITVTAAELNYVDGVTSNVQTQINTINSTLGDISTALTSILGV